MCILHKVRGCVCVMRRDCGAFWIFRKLYFNIKVQKQKTKTATPGVPETRPMCIKCIKMYLEQKKQASGNALLV